MKKKKIDETEAFAEFLNDIDEMITEKYGWDVSGYDVKSDEWIELVITPSIGSDSLNRKF